MSARRQNHNIATAMCPKETETNQSPGHFVTTNWTVVTAAGWVDSPEGSAAREVLCRIYWYPIYAYVRRNGSSPADAEDCTQSFFAHLVSKPILGIADRDKGRFRSFLLGVLRNFLRNEWHTRQTQKRGGGIVHIPIDAYAAEERYGFEPVDRITPEILFDRAWAAALMEQALELLRSENQKADKADQYERLKGFLSGGAPSTYGEAAAILGMTEGNAKTLIHRMRQRYRAIIREEIERTLAEDADPEEEMRYLMSCLIG